MKISKINLWMMRYYINLNGTTLLLFFLKKKINRNQNFEEDKRISVKGSWDSWAQDYELEKSLNNKWFNYFFTYALTFIFKL